MRSRYCVCVHVFAQCSLHTTNRRERWVCQSLSIPVRNTAIEPVMLTWQAYIWFFKVKTTLNFWGSSTWSCIWLHAFLLCVICFLFVFIGYFQFEEVSCAMQPVMLIFQSVYTLSDSVTVNDTWKYSEAYCIDVCIVIYNFVLIQISVVPVSYEIIMVFMWMLKME